MKALAIVTALLVILASPASAHSYQQGDIRIGHVWSRATPAGATTAAIYFPLLNTGTQEDKLTGAKMDAAERVEIHQTINEDGVMKMKMLDTVALDPNKPVTFQPRGMHLMVFGLKQPFKKGDKIPVTLEFEKAGDITVDAIVAETGAMTPGH